MKEKAEALLSFLKSLQCAMETRRIQETGRTKQILWTRLMSPEYSKVISTNRAPSACVGFDPVDG